MIPCTSTAMMTINFLLTMIPFFPMEFTATEKTGIVDLCGINYYSVKETDCILKSLQKEQLPEQEVLISWLKKAKEHNGFCIFGL